MLNKKLVRDLLRQKWQVFAVIVVVLLGTALFDASYLAYKNLQHSYSATQTKTHLADETVAAAQVSKQQVHQVVHIAGVDKAANQLIMSLPVTVPGTTTRDKTGGLLKVDGRLIGIPLAHQPKLNQVVIVKGHYPDTTGQILVERHFADYHHLVPGDALKIQTPAGDKSVTVSGVAVSANYLWVARNRQDVFPSPASFGVFFVPRQTLTQIGQEGLQSLHGQSASAANLKLAATATDGNRLLYTLSPGANKEAVLKQVKSVLQSSHILSVTPRNKQVDIQLLQMDLNGFKQMAEAFPLFFLTVAAFIVAALMNRMVSQERPLIGTMMAIGIRRRQVLFHYLAYSLVIGGIGVLTGTGAGVWMGDAMTKAYASQLHIPFVFTEPHWNVLLVGVMLGLIAPFVAGLVPALSASRLHPAEAMRAFTSQRRIGQPRKHRMRGPLWWRLSIRDLLRHPGRTLGTAIGVMAALVLVVTTGGLEDSMTRGLNVSVNQSQRYDLRADFYVPQQQTKLHSTLSQMKGVEQIETMLTLPVQVSNEATGKTYDTAVEGVPKNSNLLQLHDVKGSVLKPQSGAAVVTKSIAKKLGLKIGDEMKIQVLPHGPVATFKVGSFGFSLLGNAITVPLVEAQRDFHMSGQVTTALVTTSTAKRSAIHSDLGNLSGVVRVQDQAAFRTQIHQLMGLMYVMLGAMLVFAVILAASILFNTASLNILERQRELATMRALGYKNSSIIGLITAGNGLIGLLGLVIGFPLSLLTLKLYLAQYTSDLFSMPFWLYPRTIVLAVVGILLVLLFAQWPALRRVTKMNLADATKMRE
ncbi:FtsX-like permease family protein [Alicyclobacillus sp. SO9]|uniref:FtsX-like permease family protein n=1 Tax=Alicyclobacillus sp. SO9 TaxID=2665646 RepID=UPI0018E7ACCC|nr:ABC transporter permease [Alicyclobacillus sp. SO9]QQE77535.1 ABC transporter permease [Alicyclobacillus sp. SO9]